MSKTITRWMMMLMTGVCVAATPLPGEMDDPNDAPARCSPAAAKECLPDGPAPNNAPPAFGGPGGIPFGMPGMGPGAMPPGYSPPKSEIDSSENNYGTYGGGRNRMAPPRRATKASMIVKIQCPKGILDINATLLDQLLGSWVREGNSVRVSPIISMPHGPQEECLLYSIDLMGPVEKVPVPEDKEELRRLIGRFEQTLQKEYQAAQEQYRSRLRVARDLQRNTESEYILLHERGQALCKDAGMADLSRPHVLERFNHLERRRDELEMQLAGLEAQREAMNKRIIRYSTLHHIYDLQQEIRKCELQLNELFMNNPKLDDAYPDVKQLKLTIDAKRQEMAELEKNLDSERPQMYTPMPFHDILVQTNMKLLDITKDKTQVEVELQMVNRKLDDMREKDLLRLANAYHINVELMLEQAHREYQEAAELAARMECELLMLAPPRVVVLGD